MIGKIVKVIVDRPKGNRFTKEEIIETTEFQEKFFNIDVIV